MIFHITTHEAWSAATDMYRTGDEEFIHFSFASQLAATAWGQRIPTARRADRWSG